MPGADVFAACQRLFLGYPLAVRRHYAEFRYGSMVLVSRGRGAPARFSVLIMERDDLLVIRPWDRRDWPRAEVRPDGLVPAGLARLISASVPVPRDGTLLGWAGDGQVRAILAAHGRLPEPWEDPSAVPGITVLPLASCERQQWPPLAQAPAGAGLLDERDLWQHAARGQLADLHLLIPRRAGLAYWVPGALGRDHGCVVVTERLGTADCWLPAGVYADLDALRSGTAVPSGMHMLTLPGATDLAHGLPQQAFGPR